MELPLSSGSLDLALLIFPELLEQPNLVVEASWDCEIVLVSGPRQFPSRCRIRELQGVPFILFKKGSIFESKIDLYLSEFDACPNVIMRFDNAEAIKAMIRLGLGISMLPMLVVDAELKNKTLSLIRQEEPPLFAKMALVIRRSSYVPQVIRAFIEITRNWGWKNVRLTSR